MAGLTNEIQSGDSTKDASIAKVDMKFEIVVIPVSDADRAKDLRKRGLGGGSTPTMPRTTSA